MKRLFWERLAWLWILCIPLAVAGGIGYGGQAYNPQSVAITGGTINGITALGVNGGYTQTGTAANTFKGTVTITGANALRGSYGGGGITYNFASGDGALVNNTTGLQNTANGVNALYANTTGGGDTANGGYSLYSNTTGTNNTANGGHALFSNTTGNYNTANGVNAGYTATTANANVSGSNNTWIGYQAGPGVVTQLSNATALGNGALNTASNQVVLGNSAVTSNVIYGGLSLNNNLLFSATAPTISSGFGTGASISQANGTAAFTINVGTGGTASAGNLTMPAAPTGWVCFFIGVYPGGQINEETRENPAGTSTPTTIVPVLNELVSTGATSPWPSGTVLYGACTPH